MIARYAKLALLAASLILSAAAQAQGQAQTPTYTMVSGTDLDFYYDASVFSGAASVSGNTLNFSYADGFGIATQLGGTAFVVVPHQGYDLSHSLFADTSGKATLTGEGTYDASASTSIHGGTFANNTFTTQYYGLAGSAAYNQRFYFEYEEDSQGNLIPVTSAVKYNSSGGDLLFYDMDPGLSYTAYAVNFMGGVGATSQGQGVHISNAALTFYFSAAPATQPPIAPVPENATWLMMMAGVALLVAKAKASAA